MWSVPQCLECDPTIKALYKSTYLYLYLLVWALCSSWSCVQRLLLSLIDRNYSVSMMLAVQPTLEFVTIPHNITYLTGIIAGSEIGLHGNLLSSLFLYKPSQYVTSCPGQLSLAIPLWVDARRWTGRSRDSLAAHFWFCSTSRCLAKGDILMQISIVLWASAALVSFHFHVTYLEVISQLWQHSLHVGVCRKVFRGFSFSLECKKSQSSIGFAKTKLTFKV